MVGEEQHLGVAGKLAKNLQARARAIIVKGHKEIVAQERQPGSIGHRLLNRSQPELDIESFFAFFTKESPYHRLPQP